MLFVSLLKRRCTMQVPRERLKPGIRGKASSTRFFTSRAVALCFEHTDFLYFFTKSEHITPRKVNLIKNHHPLSLSS